MSNDNQQIVKTDQRQMTLTNVNGVESLIILEGENLIVKPLATVENSALTSVNQPQRLELTKAPLETLQERSERVTTYSKNDPVFNLLLGMGVFAFCFILVCLFMPKERLPYEIVTCKPTWFLFVQTGETCQTQKGFK